MSRAALTRLFREWAALLAVLAMALGPLALATSRSLGAADKIAAAGGVLPALCLPGGLPDGSGPDHDCDHCTPAQAFIPMVRLAAYSASRMGAAVAPVVSQVRVSAFPRAPPPRGPPTA